MWGERDCAGISQYSSLRATAHRLLHGNGYKSGRKLFLALLMFYLCRPTDVVLERPRAGAQSPLTSGSTLFRNSSTIYSYCHKVLSSTEGPWQDADLRTQFKSSCGQNKESLLPRSVARLLKINWILKRENVQGYWLTKPMLRGGGREWWMKQEECGWSRARGRLDASDSQDGV